MYIYKIEISNFRNFESFVWKPNPGINVLFGHNGCGKTNLAEAISLVFSVNSYEMYFNSSDFHLGDETKKILIRIWIDQVETIPAAISEHLQHIDEDDNYLPDDSNEKSRVVLIYQLESDMNQMMEWSFYQQTQQTVCKVQDRKAIDFIHVDADRQPTKEVGLQTRSTFYRMAKDSISPELEKISKEIMQFANHQLAQSDVLTSYLDTLKLLGKIDLIEKFELLIKNPESSWNASGYELGTSIGDAKFSFEKQSKGIKNLFLLLLMKKRLEGAGIIFVEELEQNLEPKYQRYIIDEYKHLMVGQLFITSHSPDVISHFDYDAITALSKAGALCLADKLTTAEKKELYRFNKKEFIAALMAKKIFLVEGDSEFESFSVFSSHCDLAFSKEDIELVRIGGKGKLELFINVFKKFDKIVYALLDNDADATKLVATASKNADTVFVAHDCYEDLLLPSITKVIDKLEELIAFSVIKDKLSDISRADFETIKQKDMKKKKLHDYIAEQCIDIDTINTYCELKEFEPVVTYILHDSFATAYYARAVAEIVSESEKCPEFFVQLVQHLSLPEKKLKLYGDYKNVFMLKGDNNA